MPDLNTPNPFGPNNFAGIGDFTAALMGGGATRQGAYRKELDAVAGLEKRLVDAARARDAYKAMQAVDDGSIGQLLGIEPGQAAPIANIVRADGMENAGAVMQALARAHELQTRQNVQGILMEPDSGYTPANAQLAGLANGPIQNNVIQGGHMILDRYGQELKPIPTDAEKARIAATQALEGQRNASAGASMARAALSNRTDPNRPRGGKPKSDAEPSNAAKPGGMASPKTKAEFDALPSGTRFRAPDGSVRVKP